MYLVPKFFNVACTMKLVQHEHVLVWWYVETVSPYIGLSSNDISVRPPGGQSAHSKSEFLLHIPGATGSTATANGWQWL